MCSTVSQQSQSRVPPDLTRGPSVVLPGVAGTELFVCYVGPRARADERPRSHASYVMVQSAGVIPVCAPSPRKIRKPNAAEHQNDPDVGYQPLREVVPEEQDVHADHDGYQR